MRGDSHSKLGQRPGALVGEGSNAAHLANAGGRGERDRGRGVAAGVNLTQPPVGI